MSEVHAFAKNISIVDGPNVRDMGVMLILVRLHFSSFGE